MRRFATMSLSALLVLAAFVGTASSHGGQYRGPNGAVPPRLREAGDPPPPLPPPPGARGPPAPFPSKTPTASDARTSFGFDNWEFWYQYNRPGQQRLRRVLHTRFAEGVNWISPMSRDKATQGIRASIKSQIVPALLRVIAAGSIHQDVRSAAYIGLAKVATKPAHVALIKRGLDHDLKHDLIVQEAAALGLGLLRRARAKEQFAAGELDGVRAFLFQVFEDAKYQARTRGFAALAIGLLGDQPSVPSPATGHVHTTERLFGLLRRHAEFKHPDLVPALLSAVSLQPPPSVTAEQREALRRCLTKGTLYAGIVPSMAQSCVALTLGRIGTRKDIGVLQRAMASDRANDANIQRSCAIGLGQLGMLVTGEDRINVAKSLLRSMTELKDASAKNFCVMSLSDLVIADVRAGHTDVLGRTKCGEFLLGLTKSDDDIQRPFGALALALVGYAIGEDPVIPVYDELRSKSVRILRDGLGARKLGKHDGAAFAVSLGLIQDHGSIKVLAALVGDQQADEALRGYAALGLGLIGYASLSVLNPIRGALRERSSVQLRQQAATALGLLQDPTRVPLLLAELKKASGSRNVLARGQVVLALGRISDESPIGPLVALLDDEKEHDYVRAMACAALGVIGDLQWQTSLSRISIDINYRAQPDVIREVLSLL